MDLTWWKNFIFSLLPNSQIFSKVKDRFFTALIGAFSSVAKDAHDKNGQNFTDIFPDSTTRADEWSDQFGFPTTLTAEQLDVQFKDTGGQSPAYLQAQLHAAGLTELFVHEWWIPGSSPVTARNPIPYINNLQPNNLLVNPAVSIYEDIPQCGDDIQCGDDVYCGDTEGLKYEEKIYAHPDIEAQYPFYFYVCGETFGTFVSLSPEQIQEAKRIIYKIKPMQKRCVLMINQDVWINTPYSGDEIWINTPYTGDEVYINLGV